MIDLTNLKAPGWGKVVVELSQPAADDRAFYERLLSVLAQVSAARQAVLWAADRREGDEVEPRPVSVWPPLPSKGASGNGDGAVMAMGEAPGASSIEQAAESKDAARSALGSGQARAFGLDKSDQYYDGAGQGYLLAVPLTSGAANGAPVGVVTLLIEQRSRDAVRSTLAMAEVLAGYVHAHMTRQALKRSQHASFALDLATRLIASINTAPSFKGAGLQLTNDLAKQFGVDRVALGWAKGSDPARGVGGDAVRVEAISDTEHFDRRMAMVQKLQAAMDECLDQQQPVLYPPPPADGQRGDVLLSQAIVHAHRELAASDAKLKVCSLPLRIDEAVVGVVTIESAGEGHLDVGTIELIQSALDLVAPVLRIRRSDDRNVALRAWDSTVKGGAWFVGPKHTVWKVVGVLLLCAAVFVTVYKTTYRVGADAVLEPREKRIVSSPFEGVILKLGTDVNGKEIEPGSVVREGDVLVVLDETQWRLSAIEAKKKMEQALLAAAAASQGPNADRGKVEQAEKQAEQAKAEMDVYAWRVSQSTIRAPISGTILGGRLKDRKGGSVKLGDALMEVAPMDDIIATAKVSDRDIALVMGALKDGRTGTGILATKARPTDVFNFTVERVVPLAESKEGKNAFEVWVKLDRAEPWLRPGMEARARFDTQRESLLWIGTRRIVDAVRLWFW